MQKAIIIATAKKAVFTVLGLIISTASLLSGPPAPTVNLAWDASSSAGVAGYKVYYGPTPGTYTNIITVGNVTNLVVSGLVEGAGYFFAAAAYDAAGVESDLSNEIAYIAPTPALISIRSVMTNGVLTAVTLTASGTIPYRWALESSSDLQTWTTLARGTNSLVNFSTPVIGMPKKFFRLKGE